MHSDNLVFVIRPVCQLLFQSGTEVPDIEIRRILQVLCQMGLAGTIRMERFRFAASADHTPACFHTGYLLSTYRPKISVLYIDYSIIIHYTGAIIKKSRTYVFLSIRPKGVFYGIQERPALYLPAYIPHGICH